MTGTLVINPEFSFYSWGNGDAEQSGDSAKAMQFFLKKNSFIFYLFIHSFIHLLMVVLGLRFCARAFSSCGKRGPLFIAVRGPLTIVASLVAEHRLQSRRRSSTGSSRAGAVAVAHGPSCSAACGLFPDQGSNPCSLNWQADSQPLRHQGSPTMQFFMSRTRSTTNCPDTHFSDFCFVLFCFLLSDQIPICKVK